MQNLSRLIYVSVSEGNLSDQVLTSILESSRVNNKCLGVTGMLLFVDKTFFQVLEGKTDTIEYLYSKISKDSRHNKIMKLIQEAIESRDFANWTMGYPKVSREELAEIDGLNDFFMSGKCFDQLDQGRTRKLLAAFRAGAWRDRFDSRIK